MVRKSKAKAEKKREQKLHEKQIKKNIKRQVQEDFDEHDLKKKELTLNPKQLEAIQYDKSPLLILAGVGTGKTQTLMSKYASLIQQGIPPENILALTFTKKAAKEMRKRAQLLTEDPLINSWIGTFHSLSGKMLRMNDWHDKVGLTSKFNIIDELEQSEILNEIYLKQPFVKQLILRHIQEELHKQDKFYIPKINNFRILSSIDKFKNSCISHKGNLNYYKELKLTKFDELIFMNIYADYQNALLVKDSADFGDLLLFVHKLMKQNQTILDTLRNKFKYILVDEVQDLNKLQQEWLKLIVGDNKHLTCVGDDDQMIYGFRGADGDFILNFEKYYKKAHIIRLEQNYRSTKSIINAANNLIQHNNYRKGKKLWTQNHQGNNVQIEQYDTPELEREYVCQKIMGLINSQYQDMNHVAILTRKNEQAREFESVLVYHNIPYKLSSTKKPFLQKLEVKKAYEYLLFLIDPHNDENTEQVILTLEGIGSETIKRLRNIQDSYKIGKKASLFEICQQIIKGDITNFRSSEKIRQQKLENTSKIVNNSDIKSRISVDLNEIEQEIIDLGLLNDDIISIQGIDAEEIKVQTPSLKGKKILSTKKIEIIQNLFKLREKFKSHADSENIVIYLTNSNFFEYLRSLCEKNGKDPYKAMKNVEALISLLEQLESVQSLMWRFKEMNKELDKHNQEQRIKVMTVHQSKGLEFDEVFLPFWTQGSMPIQGTSEAEFEEERRVAFVAITRARINVHISYHSQSKFNDKVWNKRPSQFLKELKKKR
eukprot:403354157